MIDANCLLVLIVFVAFLLLIDFLAMFRFFIFFGEFDPGSGRTLAACLTHASRTMMDQLAGLD